MDTLLVHGWVSSGYKTGCIADVRHYTSLEREIFHRGIMYACICSLSDIFSMINVCQRTSFSTLHQMSQSIKSHGSFSVLVKGHSAAMSWKLEQNFMLTFPWQQFSVLFAYLVVSSPCKCTFVCSWVNNSPKIRAFALQSTRFSITYLEWSNLDINTALQNTSESEFWP